MSNLDTARLGGPQWAENDHMNHPNRNKKAPPKAAREYMLEFDEPEADFRQWLSRQVSSYNEIARPGIDLVGHVAFKMSCTRAGAAATLKWAETGP